MRIYIAALALIFIAALILPISAFAQSVPQTLTHQGRLVDSDGAPLTGEVELVYSLYSAATGGDIIWQEIILADVDESGFYSVELGGSDPPLLPLLQHDEERWIGIIVDGGSELRPRVAMTSVPYAWIAGEAHVARSVEDGSITSEALSNDFTLPQQHLGGLSCATGDLARFDGTEWICETTDSFDISGNLQAGGQVAAESFTAQTSFFEEATLDAYPQGVSWQTGRGENAPLSSTCRYGIVQTMYFGNCRARQVCYEQDGAILSRYLMDHCAASGPWGNWVPAGP